MKALLVKILSVSAFIVLGLGINAQAFDVPATPTSSVSDFANVLDDQAEQELRQKFIALQTEKHVEIAVVTVPDLEGETIETMATKVFDTWGMGNKQYDTGLLILLAPAERKIRIEVGYGLEEFIIDALASQIINKHKSELSAGEFTTGIVGMSDDIITGVQNASFDGIIGGGKSGSSKFPVEAIFVLLIIGFQMGAILVGAMAKSKSTWLGGLIGGGIGAGLGVIFSVGISIAIAASIGIALGWLIDLWLSKKFAGTSSKKLPPWMRGGGHGGGGMWGGGFGGGSGGSSWGGFSGGSSGGGGSSGSF
ncbi:MAG TPA: TPM domain-containing protein [Candidatus Paceibacterota bacterium]